MVKLKKIKQAQIKPPLVNILMTCYKGEMVSYMHSNPDAFDEAVNLALADEKPLSWRAAWLLTNCMKENDNRMKKYIKPVLAAVRSKQEGHQRELIKILMNMRLNEDQEAELFDICVDIWKNITKAPAVRYNAFKFIIEISRKYPELIHETSALMQERYLAGLTPGAMKSICRIIDEFYKETGLLKRG